MRVAAQAVEQRSLVGESAIWLIGTGAPEVGTVIQESMEE